MSLFCLRYKFFSDAVPDEKREQFVERIWKSDPNARHLDSEQNEWDFLWIALVIGKKALCDKAWKEMGIDHEHRVRSVLDAANVCCSSILYFIMLPNVILIVAQRTRTKAGSLEKGLGCFPISCGKSGQMTVRPFMLSRGCFRKTFLLTNWREPTK